MFFGSDNGGRTGAVLSSLIATCKHLRIDPFGYLHDVFSRIGTPKTASRNCFPTGGGRPPAGKVAERKEDSLHGALPTTPGQDLDL